uniref:FAD dependent oxidoreductase domain-containing protein n=1 Tax=Ciona intestinalis TaxID=7719 RepID=F6YME4_CIOIN
MSGGKLIKKHISSFEDLSDFDIIINCAGIGAKFLTSDKELYPVKGQTITTWKLTKKTPIKYGVTAVSLNQVCDTAKSKVNMLG